MSIVTLVKCDDEHLGQLNWPVVLFLGSYWASLMFQGGEPDLQTVGKMVLNDWQRGRIPFFVKPPNAEPPTVPQVRAGWTQFFESMALIQSWLPFRGLPF